MRRFRGFRAFSAGLLALFVLFSFWLLSQDEAFFSRLGWAHFAWLILLACAPIAAFGFVSAVSTGLSNAPNSHFFLIFLLGGVVVLFGAFLALAPNEFRSPFAILGSAFLATVGWIVQQRNSRDLQRKHYTLMRVEEYRSDREYMLHRNNIRRVYAAKAIADDREVALRWTENNDPQNYQPAGDGELPISKLPVLNSILEILNFYEEVCHGIRRGEIDEETIWNTISSIMMNFFNKVLPLIKIAWRKDRENFEHIRWVVNKWTWEIKARTPERRDSELYVDFEAVAPAAWTNALWKEDGQNLEWGEGDGPWGDAAVEQYLQKLATGAGTGGIAGD